MGGTCNYNWFCMRFLAQPHHRVADEWMVLVINPPRHQRSAAERLHQVEVSGAKAEGPAPRSRYSSLASMLTVVSANLVMYSSPP
jgi:hypothetical protein